MNMATGTVGELKGLLSLIVESAATAERYISRNQISPQGGKPNDPELRSAICVIEAACTQLTSLVARPTASLVHMYFACYESACIQVVLANKIPDILAESPSGVHISELEKRTGVNAEKLGRVLRLLVAKYVFQEVSRDTFANNHLSSHLVSSNPVSSFGLLVTEMCLKGASSLSDTLNDPALTASMSPVETPFCKNFNFDGNFFDYLAGSAPKQVALGSLFSPGLIGWYDAVEAHAVVYDFPWKQLPAGSTVCDLGGGIGDIAMQLAKAHPSLRIVLQDVPHKLLEAKDKVWPERCPEAISERRIEFLPIDFFQESPKQCDIYYLRHILHDWNDEDCIKILKNIKSAMKPSSRVLIQEFVIQPAYRVPEGKAQFKQAPEPLLANYGGGRIRQFSMDINMMVLLNGKERTLEDFTALGRSSGLRFVKLWEMGEMSVVEFMQ